MAAHVNHIAVYFSNHPGFIYNPGNAAWAEFDRLRLFLGHPDHSTAFRRERGRFAEAFICHVNATYGEGRASLVQWQELCRVCRIVPVPLSITKCRQALRRIYVNIFDAIDALTTGAQVRRFPDIPALREYSISNHKIIARRHAKAGGAVRDLLRQLF